MRALSAEEGVATERMRRWVSTMALLSALERVGGDQDRFLLKGGVALELRFKLRARATRDVDLIVTPHGDADLVDALEDALAEPHLEFGYLRWRYCVRRREARAQVLILGALALPLRFAEQQGAGLRVGRLLIVVPCGSMADTHRATALASRR